MYVGSIKLSYLNGVFFAKSIGHIYLGIFKLEYLTQYSAGLSQAGWGGGWGGWGTFSLPPQFLADQLILSQPGGPPNNTGTPRFSDLPTALYSKSI